MDDRKPVTWINYQGDHRGIDRRTPLGPNTMGEQLWPVTARYDDELDMTRVGFSYIAPAEVSS